MKKLLLIAFCVAVASMFGCALVDYGCIYDYDQTSSNPGGEPPWPNALEMVNTAGKAHVIELYKVMTTFPDHAEETLWFVDQTAAGDQKLNTFINVEPAIGWTWHDDYYCNPDWNGCAWVSADRPYPKCVGGYDYYPFSVNWSCSDITYGYLWSSGPYRYGECGRVLPLSDKIAILNMGELSQRNGMEGLVYNMNRKNFGVTLENEYGNSWNVPINASLSMFWNPKGGQLQIDRSNPILANMMKWYGDWLEKNATTWTTVTINYNGISNSFKIVGNGGFSADAYRNAANKLY